MWKQVSTGATRCTALATFLVRSSMQRAAALPSSTMPTCAAQASSTPITRMPAPLISLCSPPACALSLSCQHSFAHCTFASLSLHPYSCHTIKAGTANSDLRFNFSPASIVHCAMCTVLALRMMLPNSLVVGVFCMPLPYQRSSCLLE